eukprot:SAG22_NODE_14469_length_374_cov_0.745455_1_plen_76_part_10
MPAESAAVMTRRADVTVAVGGGLLARPARCEGTRARALPVVAPACGARRVPAAMPPTKYLDGAMALAVPGFVCYMA